MDNIRTSTLWLTLALVVVACSGFYLTSMRQPAQIKKLEKEKELAEMKKQKVSGLIDEKDAKQKKLARMIEAWRSRYKKVPENLTTEDVTRRLNDLTESGFETFNVFLNGKEEAGEYSYWQVGVEGKGSYEALYDLIWQVENRAPFWSIENLAIQEINMLDPGDGSEVGREYEVLSQFNLQFRAYFGGPEVPEEIASYGELDTLTKKEEEGSWQNPARDTMTGEVPVPPEVLADRAPSENPFSKLIREETPPNVNNRVNVEKDSLVSIAGGEAVFRIGEGQYQKVREGGKVYLGQITNIAPQSGEVEVVLNKAGVVERRTLSLEPEGPFDRPIQTSSSRTSE